jgi:hypothetical protein
MIERSPTLRAFQRTALTVRNAVSESKLAYELSPNAYSYSCMIACLAAERALEALRATLEEEAP